MTRLRRHMTATAAAAALILSTAGLAHASSVDVTATVSTSPTVSEVTLQAGASTDLSLKMSVTGAQAGTATFEVYRNWHLAAGAFTGSNAKEFTVAPRAGGDPAATYLESGTLSVAADTAPGTYVLRVGVFDITNSNATGGKLAAGSAGTLDVVVTVPPPSNTPPVLHLPADITTTATGGSGATVTYLATATDDQDGALTPACTPASGSVFTVGTTTVSCEVTDSGGLTATGSFTVTVAYAWSGFLRPVDNLPTVNRAKAGQAIPVKFSLSGDQGLAVFAATPGSRVVNGPVGASIDLVEEVAAPGASGLTYDAATDTYTYVWKTDKGWAGTHRELQVRLADGSVHTASFQFTK